MSENPVYRTPFLYIVKRDRWKALPPVTSERLVHPVERLFVMYTGHQFCRNKSECNGVMRQMQKSAMDDGYPDILYNFCIGGDARVYEGRGWDVKVDRPDIDYWKEGSLMLGYIGDRFIDGDVGEMLIRKGYRFMRHAIRMRYLISHLKVCDPRGIIAV